MRIAILPGITLLFAGILISAAVVLLLDEIKPFSTKNLVSSIGSDTRDAKLAEKLTKTMAEHAPLVPPEEVIPCMEFERPGVIIGRFCHQLTRKDVNLRVTPAIPVAALRQLPNLLEIVASGSRWPSLEPLLEFSTLTSLYLSGSQIEDFSALPRFGRLEKLDLSDTNFDAFSDIAGMTELKILGLSDLPISDLAPLAEMRNLEVLYLKGTPITDLTPLAGMSKLKTLDIRDTNVTDLRALEGISGLTIYCGFSNFSKTLKNP